MTLLAKREAAAGSRAATLNFMLIESMSFQCLSVMGCRVGGTGRSDAAAAAHSGVGFLEAMRSPSYTSSRSHVHSK